MRQSFNCANCAFRSAVVSSAGGVRVDEKKEKTINFGSSAAPRSWSQCPAKPDRPHSQVGGCSSDAARHALAEGPTSAWWLPRWVKTAIQNHEAPPSLPTRPQWAWAVPEHPAPSHPQTTATIPIDAGDDLDIPPFLRREPIQLADEGAAPKSSQPAKADVRCPKEKKN